MFEHVEPFAGDPILSLNEDFQKDPRPHKINLSIGIYFDDAGPHPGARLGAPRRAAGGRHGRPPSRTCRSKARPTFAARCRQLLFGADHEAVAAGRVATIQSVGSSGGLKVGADFIARWLPGSAGLGQRPDLGQPSLDVRRRRPHGPHLPVLRRRDRRPRVRRDAAPRCARLPAKSVVLLHACCHNPTGVDLTRAQWDALMPILRERELLPYLDLAYQGFGDGIDEDAYALRALAAARGATAGRSRFFVANSFSKSMSVYGERCGALSVVCADAGAGRPTCSASSSSRCGATTRARRSTAARSSPRCSTEPDLRRAWEAELGGDARAHPGDAQGAARRPRGQGAGSRLRLLPDPARHVQLHRPDRRARSIGCARSSRSTWCARAGCASPG